MELLKDLEQGAEILKNDLELLSNSISNIGFNEDKTIDKDQVENALDRVVTSYENILIDIDNAERKIVDITKPKSNIYRKLQAAKVKLQKKDLKKSGFNKYSNYKYFELGDFLPYINEICLEVGLSTEIRYTTEVATLYIRDLDNPQEVIKWDTPVKIPTLKGCSEIQAIGASQTFSRRYLYTLAFDIAENDAIDGGEIDVSAEEGKRKINKAAFITIKSLIDQSGADEKKFLSWIGVSKVEDITNEALNKCIEMLEKKKKDIDLKKQQEEHQKELEQRQEDFEF
ncbi:ERF family protein [Clostridium sardiniense]|uniref:ERF family protein n=1 Tax=Clostridium sardiniense TaxID=29369 RepID=A0ABS7KUQ9_CLOSR|nr:ERF family protein [Clostridium sardiniense]MBY0754554.1 ERF family protein [Clostridium sardiniense]MDQ0460849.1 hypothetical protein [Clostridium sardiniense]